MFFPEYQEKKIRTTVRALSRLHKRIFKHLTASFRSTGPPAIRCSGGECLGKGTCTDRAECLNFLPR